MANIPPIQFKRSDSAGAQPTSGDLIEGELAINFPDGKIYSKNPQGTIVALGGSGAAASDSEGPITVIDWKAGSATVLPKANVFTVFTDDPLDSDWYLQSDIAASPKGSVVRDVVFVKGERTSFDSTTQIWLDGTTTTNQAPSGNLTITSNTSVITDGPSTLENHYTDVMGLNTSIGGYTPSVISCRNQNRLGVYGWSNSNDYLIRFWWQHDNVTMTNNYTRLFGFTAVNQASTGSTTSSIDPQLNSPAYYVGCINNQTQGRININGSGTAVTFNWPNGNVRAADAKQLATFSCDYVSTGNWTIRLWIDNTFIDEQTGIDLTASNMHFQFGTGNSSDDRDGNHSFTHLQVDEYTSGNMPARFVSSTNLTETDNLYKTTPTLAYHKDYSLAEHHEHIKIGGAGANGKDDWYHF